MERKARLKLWLEFTRKRTDGLLSAFQSREDWVHQIFPGANHALWIVGHIGWVDNAMLNLIGCGDKRIELGDMKALFRIKSEPSGNAADYPPAATVLAMFRERRSALLAELDRFSEDDLNRPCAPGGPDVLFDVASVFELSSVHESTHAGQLTMIRRALGHSPAFL